MSHAQTKTQKLQQAKRLYLLTIAGLTDIEVAKALEMDRASAYRYRKELEAVEVEAGRYTVEPTEEDVLLAKAVLSRMEMVQAQRERESLSLAKVPEEQVYLIEAGSGKQKPLLPIAVQTQTDGAGSEGVQDEPAVMGEREMMDPCVEEVSSGRQLPLVEAEPVDVPHLASKATEESIGAWACVPEHASVADGDSGREEEERFDEGMDAAEVVAGKQEKKGLRRYYSKYKERPTAYYDPLSGQLYSEKSRVHVVGRAAVLEAVLEACDCPVLYLLPDATGGYPTASDYYQIAGIEVKKYLEKRQAATVRYQGKSINVYPIATWCDVALGDSLKGVIQGLRTVREELEKSFQPRSVTAERAEKFLIPLLATPSQMGADLLKRSLPYEQVYEPLPEDTALTILQELGQGRIETFYHGQDEVEQVYAYDGRWMYASCLRHVPVGPVLHDDEAAILPYVPGFYRVEVSIPREWQHIGLLPMRNPTGSSQKFSYPRQGGQVFESWCTSSELSLALKEGWQVQVRERILWPQTHVLPEPLKLWGERLIALRMEKAPTYAEPLRSILQAAVRNILLHTAGGFHRVTREFDGYTSDVTAIPATATSFELLPDGEIWRYTQADRLSPLQQMLSQPHWAATIWGAARKKLAAQALQIPYADLMALRVDAVWTVREMFWKDTGKIGVFRREFLHDDRGLRWPRNTGEMVPLVQRTKGRED